MTEKEPIKVWRFEDAPEELKALSDHGGDEDWLAEIPASLSLDDGYIGWMESGTDFGVFRVSRYPHPSKPGWQIRIGAHS